MIVVNEEAFDRFIREPEPISLEDCCLGALLIHSMNRFHLFWTFNSVFI